MDDPAPGSPQPLSSAPEPPEPTRTPYQNRLAGESSPYLRTHAHNPVDWYPWGAQALDLARRERKPILLSIGYAACHWCHVMAHESFEDPATAADMNALYVNVKVDREERPDLDRIYQLAQQMLIGRGGGWPLTMFLMHDDQRPFFGGTYFPPQPRHGLPAFRDLLRQVASYYRTHLDELRANAAQVVAALADVNAPPVEGTALSAEPLRLCRARLEQSFDAEYGGFGAAPKFPHPHDIARLLRDWYASAGNSAPDLQALYMASLTLTRMAEGGLFDQLGGGFFRYSVDARWEIPHFEKMLYDNAQLLAVYAEAALATGEALFREVAERTAEFMLRELAAPDGALYSSLDADSEGHEGRFYLWDRAAARSALAPIEFNLLAARFGLDSDPNFEGRWHLLVRTSVNDLAEWEHLAPPEAQHQLESAMRRLFELRAQRVRPALDDKSLTSWNALAIRGLAIAARCLQRPDYAQRADAALQYLRRVHRHQGRLLATSVAGRAQLPAYLDDYAFLIDALLELARVRFRVEELHWAIELTELMLRHFEDRTAGGFYFTADDHEQLISRSKSFSDEAIPAGNAVAARVLLLLGYLLGEPRYLIAAERTVRAGWAAVLKYPEAHASMLLALEQLLAPPEVVLLRGPEAALAQWRQTVEALFAPDRYVLTIPDGVDGLPPALAAKPARETVVAYVCRGTQCSAPIDSLEALLAQLAAEGGARVQRD